MAAETTGPVIDKTKPYFPRAGVATDGWSNEDEATATCFCGAVQMVFPTHGPGYVGSFICNCSDCHKLTASMFATNFTVDEKYLKYVRGKENLQTYSQSDSIFAKTVPGGNTMTNYFCKTCGSLMYRIGAAWPGFPIMRVGSVDDFSLHETKLKPTMEQFTKHRPSWLPGVRELQQAYDDNLHKDWPKVIVKGPEA